MTSDPDQHYYCCSEFEGALSQKKVLLLQVNCSKMLYSLELSFLILSFNKALIIKSNSPVGPCGFAFSLLILNFMHAVDERESNLDRLSREKWPAVSQT